MIAAAEADPDLHNGYNDCNDADCMPCNAALDELGDEIVVCEFVECSCGGAEHESVLV